LSDARFLSHELSVLRHGYGPSIVDLGVVDKTGRQVAYAGPFNLGGADYSNADWFKEAMDREWYISDVFQGLRELPHFIVAVRRVEDGRPWILRATVDFDAFNSIVRNIRIGATGFAFIINRSGDLQTKAPFGEIESKAVYLRALQPDGHEGADAALVSDSDAQGREILNFMAPLKNGEWLLGYQQYASDAFSPLQQARRLALAIFCVGVLGIVIAGVTLSNRMARRIREADQEKEDMTEQVIESGKLASLGELAAGIAHEINNPVAIMVEEAGWMEDLLEDGAFDGDSQLPEFRRSLQQIRTQGKRCKEITHKLLSFARKTDPTQTKMQLNDLVQEVVELCRQRARFDNVTIVTDLAGDLPEIDGAPSALQQVLLNLINNSLDAMESKGGEVEVTTHREGSRVVLKVADQGPGIPEALVNRIFDPFFTTKPVGAGTGLGLSICYGIVDKMGGEICVDSAVGVGTVFTVKLPTAAVEPSRQDEARPENQSSSTIPAVSEGELQ
ncbi:MAG: two-component sensor histidine kinase, partial [candidate division Zixibacteria bacterium]|nr:two-component sensor histidine kinase [candidate division Zixibacteria bacterium]